VIGHMQALDGLAHLRNDNGVGEVEALRGECECGGGV
jgi:hypothetical protein